MTIQLEEVYEEYNRYIYHLCLKLTRNKAEAEDLMQEVWMKVVRYESYVAQVDHLKAWLTTICMNTFRDRYRKNVRRSKYMMNQPDTLDVPVLDLVPNNEPTTEELIEQEDVAQLVQAKINQLDGIYRNTLLYFYVKQYSLVEIAELMKVSIGTVKSRLFRAKQRLKEMMLQDDTTATAILPA
ncbi:RNA polymerase sigma factor [Kurthia gibsonii]|uniref:RNA polymerase sigma factor n=1 Tax=Kurthia gibsonii TaxID=33946 RepID=UPI002DBB9775|nr:RNA polymerase sigma factor [Kurthia gibsonii]MEB6113066.1 RNA polymerase sigma factor [Kurthia gibsonii]